MKRWLSAHKFTIGACLLVAGVITWLAVSGYDYHRQNFWEHPWWWYLIWAAGILAGAALRVFRPREPRSTLWDGDPRDLLPCPPGCKIKVAHIHERPHAQDS